MRWIRPTARSLYHYAVGDRNFLCKMPQRRTFHDEHPGTPEAGDCCVMCWARLKAAGL